MRSYQSPPLYSFVIDELSVEIENEIDENNNDLSLNSVKSGISEQNIQEIMSLTNALNESENDSFQPNISIIDSYSISQEDFENIVVDEPIDEKTITSEFELVSKDSFQEEKVDEKTEISDTNQLETFKCGICNAEECFCQNTQIESIDFQEEEEKTEITDTNQLKSFECEICNSEECYCQNTTKRESIDFQEVEEKTEISDKNQLETFKCGICNAEKCSCQNTKSEPFDCNDCSQSFVSNSSLNEHITEVHVKVDSFWCENCGTDDWFECMCDD